MSRALTASELALWPLVHGSLFLDNNVDSIRVNGLRAPGAVGRAINSFDYDRVLGRTEFVFLSPVRISGGYGLGSVILVDPAAMLLPGVRGALHDVGNVVRQVDRLANDPEHELPEWVLAPNILRRIVEDQSRRTERRAILEGVPPELRRSWVESRTHESVISSTEFSEYADSYLMEPGAFFSALAATYSDAGHSICDFIQRGNWTDEEILVPSAVPPDYLLGYRSDGAWHHWGGPSSSEIDERLSELLALWTMTTP